MRQYFVVLMAMALVAGPADAAAQVTPARSARQADAELVQPVPPSFDHSAFDALLRAHVQKGLVNYSAFRNNPEFTRYLASLKAAKLDGLEEAERIAFWLNVYNANKITAVVSTIDPMLIPNVYPPPLGQIKL